MTNKPQPRTRKLTPRDDVPGVMDADQTAAYLGVGVKTVKRLITNKKIPAVMVGNTWRVPRRTLDDILDQEGKRNLNGNDRH